ncbi:MAG: hypothetical protein IJC26_01880 [Clostridia bacterium]|nr:hypothetical protein [Clostridia bacterium]
MQLLRMGSILLFACALVFSLWANARYYSTLNSDDPVIRSDTEELVISASEGQEALLRGLVAEDATDGDLTSEIMVSSISHFLEPGVVKVRYVVFDRQNNSATLERRVRYTDYVPPRFALDSPPVYRVGESFELLDQLKASDVLDGDISRKVRLVSSSVSIFSSGTYPVTLEVSNSCGQKSQITIYVTYQREAEKVQIDLHEYIVYVEQGEAFDPMDCVASVFGEDRAPLSKEKIRVLGTPDLKKPGCYRLEFLYEDGALRGTAPLTVVVTEGGAHGK